MKTMVGETFEFVHVDEKVIQSISEKGKIKQLMNNYSALERDL